MSSPAKGLLDPFQGAGHPLRNWLAPQLEVSPSGLRAIMREAQKIEGLRSALPTLPTAPGGEPSELDEPGLVRVQRQVKTSEPFFHGVQEVFRVFLVLENPPQNHRRTAR